MNEDEVKKLTKKWLEKQGFKVHSEVAVGESREVILDFYGFKDGSPPKIIWVECKGDENLSELLEGFIRTEFAVYDRGGLGILSIPHKATKKLIKYKDFLKQAENIIGILDIEKNRLIKLKSDESIHNISNRIGICYLDSALSAST